MVCSRSIQCVPRGYEKATVMNRGTGCVLVGHVQQRDSLVSRFIHRFHFEGQPSGLWIIDNIKVTSTVAMKVVFGMAFLK